MVQEAKRFQAIDKAWLRIMQKAHDDLNVVQCCVGDETLGHLLPHLLEQLEVCQKSLTGFVQHHSIVETAFQLVSLASCASSDFCMFIFIFCYA